MSSSSVTEATATRREKTVCSSLNIANVAQAAGAQELARISLLTAVMNQEGEGTSDMQTYARKQLVALGVVTPNEEEKKQMEEADANASPDAGQVVLEAQAKALEGQAVKDHALAGKAIADTGLAKAKTVDILSDAHIKHQPANDAQGERSRAAGT